MSNLSPSTLALLRAAKTDSPTKESRAAIWGGVTSGLVTHTPLHITPHGAGAGAGASTAPAAVGMAGAGKAALLGGSMTATMKAAFVGALFGSAISIGVATVMLRAKPADPSPTQSQLLRGPALPGQSIGGAALPGTNVDPNVQRGSAQNATANAAPSELSNSNGIEIDPTSPTTADRSSGSGSNSATSANAAAVDPSSLTLDASRNNSPATHHDAVAKSHTRS
ncbi:MAG: hypothetical protein ABI461_22640, partial [Polyangiaceae bacterium]